MKENNGLKVDSGHGVPSPTQCSAPVVYGRIVTRYVFFIADPIFVPKFLTLDSKSMTYFVP